MSTDAGFVPWRDDAFLEQESLYALWNKISWFAAVKPVALLRACRSVGRRAVVAPKGIDYAYPGQWVDYTKDCTILPRVQGCNVDDLVRRIEDATLEEVPRAWASPSLRICTTCMEDGVHLRIHQHLAVSRCPLHDQPLRDTCPTCGTVLRYGSEKNKAFRCAACGISLLADDMVGFMLSPEDRCAVAQAHDEACRWLRYLEGGIYREHLGDQVIGLSDYRSGYLDVRSLLLAALSQAFPQRPSWLARPAEPMEGLSLASLQSPESLLRRGFTSGALANPRYRHWLETPASSEPMDAGPQLEDEGRLLVAHYQQALRRVASQFHRATGDTHHACLDAPLLIKKGDREENTFDFAIFTCCPVALGYWLWRKRSGTFFIDMVYYGPPSLRQSGAKGTACGNDLLLYSIERSHLHACLVAARAITSTWRSSDSKAVGLCLDMLAYWSSSRLYTSSTKGEQLYFDPSSQEFTFVRVDATSILKQAECSGLEPYYWSLRRKLRSVSIYNPRTIQMETVSMEEQWQARAAEQIDRLPPMEYDWIFYDAVELSQMRLWRHEARHARTCVADMKIDPFEVIQRAINGRSASSALPRGDDPL